MPIHNAELQMSLDDAIAEVLGLLTGLDLQYAPEQDRYQVITRQLNRAMRSVALEKEWSWYADVQQVGTAVAGQRMVTMSRSIRVRQVNDDAARLVGTSGQPLRWAYFLPRDALHKYVGKQGLWCSVTRNELLFSRPFFNSEDGLGIEVPIMREPTMFRLPEQPEDPSEPLVEVPDAVRQQPLDFAYPDLVILRAAFFYAQTDPVMQPRVQTIEAQYKDLMYQLLERDDRMTDSPYLNEFRVPVQSSLIPEATGHWHPHSDSGW